MFQNRFIDSHLGDGLQNYALVVTLYLDLGSDEHNVKIQDIIYQNRNVFHEDTQLETFDHQGEDLIIGCLNHETFNAYLEPKKEAMHQPIYIPKYCYI